MNTDERAIAVYASPRDFRAFVKMYLGKQLPEQIAVDMLPGSNTARGTLMSTLKKFELLTKEGVPTECLRVLTASEEDYAGSLKDLLHVVYPALMDHSDLNTITVSEVSEIFQAAGASGSTVPKCITLFIALASDAGVSVNPQLKPNRKRQPKETPEPIAQRETVTIYIKGKEDAVITFPTGLDKNEAKRLVKVATFNLREALGVPDE